MVISQFMPNGSLYDVIHGESGTLLCHLCLFSSPYYPASLLESSKGNYISDDKAANTFDWLNFVILVLHLGIVVDQAQALRFSIDIARGMEFLHTLEPMIHNFTLTSKHIMVSTINVIRISYFVLCKYNSYECVSNLYIYISIS